MNKSIQNINELPSIRELKKISQGLALLDAITMPEWEYRYFSFNCNWDGSGEEMMASMRDGAGSEYFLHFSDKGVIGKVLFENSLVDSSSCLKVIPACFSGFKNEKSFSLDNASFFFWRGNEDNKWSASPNAINDYPLLGFLAKGYLAYKDWAEGYYERSFDDTALKEVFNSLNVTPDQIAILNPELAIEDLEEDIKEIKGKRGQSEFSPRNWTLK